MTSQRAGQVIVSHDREFLARTVTEIVELDLAQQQVAHYDGGYQAYLDERAIARRQAREAYEENADRRQDLTDRARMQRNWMDQGARNARRKAGKDPDKIIRNSGRRTPRSRRPRPGRPSGCWSGWRSSSRAPQGVGAAAQIAAAPRSGTVVAVLDQAVVARGAFRLGPVDLQVDWADRIAITGAERQRQDHPARRAARPAAADRGTPAPRPRRGGRARSTRPAACSAAHETLPQAFGRLLPDWPDADVRTLLAKFGLRAAHVDRPAASLSPGERTRAALALLQGRGVNLLVLDEPTNHLDLPAIEQLEQALDGYPGTLLLVSHDRRLLDAVRVTRRVAVAGGRVSVS